MARSNTGTDVWGSILSLTQSSLERDAKEGESPVEEGERSDPDEYRALAELGKMGVLTSKSKYVPQTDSELVARANAEKHPGRGVKRA